MTICNMSIEAGARAGMVAPDETTFAYLEGRPHAPKGQDWEEGFDHAVVIECESEAEAGSRARGMRDFLEVNQPSMEECGVQQLTFGTAVTDGNKIGEYSSPFLPARRSSEPSPC